MRANKLISYGAIITVITCLVVSFSMAEAKEGRRGKKANSGATYTGQGGPKASVFSGSTGYDIRNGKQRAKRFRQLNRGQNVQAPKSRARVGRSKANTQFPNFTKRNKRIAKEQRIKARKIERAKKKRQKRIIRAKKRQALAKRNKRAARAKHRAKERAHNRTWTRDFGPGFGHFFKQAKRAKAQLKRQKRRAKARRIKRRQRAIAARNFHNSRPRTRVEHHYHDSESSGPSLGEILYGINTAMNLFNQFSQSYGSSYGSNYGSSYGSSGYAPGYGYYDYAPAPNGPIPAPPGF